MKPEKEKFKNQETPLRELYYFLKNDKTTFDFISSQLDLSKFLDVDPSELNRLINNGGAKEKEDGLITRILEELQIKRTPKGYQKRTTEEWTNLKRLADKLALNLIDVSMDFESNCQPHLDIIKDVELRNLVLDSPNRKKERFILVTGAGASHAATNGHMFLANKAMQYLDNAKKNNKHLNKLIEKELSRQEIIYRAPTNNLESKLLASSKYDKETVVRSLREICGNRHLPSLSYEVMAHMLKHRVIDAIINFNYDEILDNAVEDEMPEGNYSYIFSDGHVPNEYQDMLLDNRLKEPVVIKPHGTISHISSLRFIGESVFTMVPEIRDIIYELFKGQTGDRADSDYLPLNLIIIGFSMQSAEFNGLIKKYLRDYPNRKITFWFFDKKRTLSDFNLDLDQEEEKRIRDNVVFFDLNRTNLDDVLVTLWQLIKSNLNEPYQPRGIERHRLISLILSSYQGKLLAKKESKSLFTEEAQYYLDRFFVELLITFLQSDGIINARQLTQERPGKYFNLYRKHKRNASMHKLVCSRFNLRIHKDWVSDTFVHQRSDIFFHIDELIEDLFQKLDDTCEHLELRSKKEKFKILAKRIRERNLMKITPNYIHPHQHIFPRLNNKNILSTSLRWIYDYKKTLSNKDEWDLMMVISEKGRFLNQYIPDIKGKKVELILASYDADEFDDLSESQLNHISGLNLLSQKPLFLPWWLHNQHMVLFLKRKAGQDGLWQKKWSIPYGFYYQSRLLSRRINPVFLTHAKDTEVLLRTFANYWFRAKSYTDQDKRYVPIIRSKKALDKQINELLDLYEG